MSLLKKIWGGEDPIEKLAIFTSPAGLPVIHSVTMERNKFSTLDSTL